jgi:hypothetical protein
MPAISRASARPALDPLEVDRRVHALLDQDGSGKLNQDEWIGSGRSVAAFAAAGPGADGRLGVDVAPPPSRPHHSGRPVDSRPAGR